jgi:predicted phosphate transport protein (TIGR00153 family)
LRVWVTEMGRSKLLSWIIPTEKRFFDMLEEQANKNIEASNALNKLLNDYRDVKKKVKKINEMEDEGDSLRHNIIEDLNKTFITPIDREDINAISDLLDDILDFIEGTSTRMFLYDVQEEEIPKEFIDLSALLVEANEIVRKAIREMANGFKDFKTFHHKIHELENKGDTIQRNAIAEVFTSKDAIQVIKWKEIIETLENAIDKCEDVSDIIDGVRMKFT